MFCFPLSFPSIDWCYFKVFFRCLFTVGTISFTEARRWMANAFSMFFAFSSSQSTWRVSMDFVWFIRRVVGDTQFSDPLHYSVDRVYLKTCNICVWSGQLTRIVAVRRVEVILLLEHFSLLSTTNSTHRNNYYFKATPNRQVHCKRGLERWQPYLWWFCCAGWNE